MNPFLIVAEFEQTIAAWAGSKYGVAVESGTAAIFLSCVYSKVGKVTIPARTYPSVPCSIIHAGGEVEFRDYKWSGVYQLEPYLIWDSALRFQPNMYKPGLYCLSFHMKKHLPIGRGGMILTDDKDAYNWLKRARFDGRREVPLEEDSFDMLGYNMYMEAEQATRGLRLFSTIDQRGKADLEVEKQGYPDLRRFDVYRSLRK